MTRWTDLEVDYREKKKAADEAWKRLKEHRENCKHHWVRDGKGDGFGWYPIICPKCGSKSVE